MDVDLSGNGDREMEIKRWRPDRFGKTFLGKSGRQLQNSGRHRRILVSITSVTVPHLDGQAK